MTTVYFNPKESLLVSVVLYNNNFVATSKMVFDTGASRIMIPKKIAKDLGLLGHIRKTTPVTTASTAERVPIVVIPKVSIAGATVNNVEAMVKDLPEESYVDGLLGLNFIKHFNVNIDFKSGKLTLNKYL